MPLALLPFPRRHLEEEEDEAGMGTSIRENRKRLSGSGEEEPAALMKACKRACGGCPGTSLQREIPLLSADGCVVMVPRDTFGVGRDRCIDFRSPIPTPVRSEVLQYLVASLQAASVIAVRESLSVAQNVELLAASEVRCEVSPARA